MDQRTEERLSLQKRCILEDQHGWIGTHTIDISKIGLGVKTDNTLPLRLKNGCELSVLIESTKLPPAKIMWTKKDNKTTSLGLKFLPSK